MANRSFHNSVDYALSPELARALEDLVALGRQCRLAIMCSEAVWWRCHPRILTDYLLLNGYGVDHLFGASRIESANPTLGARRMSDGKVVYPRT